MSKLSKLTVEVTENERFSGTGPFTRSFVLDVVDVLGPLLDSYLSVSEFVELAKTVFYF